MIWGLENDIRICRSQKTADGESVAAILDALVAAWPHRSAFPGWRLTWTDPGTSETTYPGTSVADEKHYLLAVSSPEGRSRYSAISTKTLRQSREMIQSLLGDLITRLQRTCAG